MAIGHQGAIRATLAGMLDQARARRGDVSLPPGTRLDGRTVMVTGASRGLGLAIAQGLGGLGARVVAAVRSRGPETAAAIDAAGGRGSSVPLDLERLASVDALVDRLVADGTVLDAVVLNAGMVPVSARRSPDGLDAMFQVNFLSNVHLVDRLRATGRLAAGARVVIVGSESHRTAAPIDFDAFGVARDYGTTEVVAEYGKTKLHLHTWAVELGRRAPELAVHHLCPGAVASEIAREAPRWSQPLLNLTFRLFFQPPAVAARPVLWLVAAPDVGCATGRYLHMTATRDPRAEASDPENGRRVWDAAHDVITRIREA